MLNVFCAMQIDGMRFPQNWLDVADQIMFENGKISPKLEDMMQPNSAEIFAGNHLF